MCQILLFTSTLLTWVAFKFDSSFWKTRRDFIVNTRKSPFSAARGPGNWKTNWNPIIRLGAT